MLNSSFSECYIIKVDKEKNENNIAIKLSPWLTYNKNFQFKVRAMHHENLHITITHAKCKTAVVLESKGNDIIRNILPI